ncbi:hypothetical protein PsYK624_049510 [Phanerochaete sordida]|uniref:DUF6533 domain-containing protein n=1 Tax=Phanerochaete sordida TaxID=48140 RepID=A0A9P3G7H8_9APHY|nr:hypothetical protein PsYK624_049510 [Phanerochaete sordida]
MSMETSDADLAFRNIQITYGLISLSASIIVLYEYAVTLPQEVEAVWKREWTATSILLLTIRWTMVTLGVCYVLQPLQYSDTLFDKRANPTVRFGTRLARGGSFHRTQDVRHMELQSPYIRIDFYLGSCPRNR